MLNLAKYSYTSQPKKGKKSTSNYNILGRWCFQFLRLKSSRIEQDIISKSNHLPCVLIQSRLLWRRLLCSIYSLLTIHLWRRFFSCKCLPNHIDSIPWLRWISILEMMSNFFELFPHLSPLILPDSPEKINQESRFYSIWLPNKYAELGVIQDILKR